MLITGYEIVCPTGNPEKSPILINIKALNAIEGRIHEVAFVTPQKCPELLAMFNKGYLDLHHHITVLIAERMLAERNLGKIKAVIVLDKAPTILKEKGLPPNSLPSIKQALFDSDNECLAAQERVDQITCVIELLSGKLKAFEMAYNSVKKILGGDNNFSHRRNTDLNGDTGSAPTGGNTYNNPGFGKAEF